MLVYSKVKFLDSKNNISESEKASILKVKALLSWNYK